MAQERSCIVGAPHHRNTATTYDLDGEITAIGDNFSHYAYTFDGQGNVASVDNAGTPGVPDVVLASQYDPAGNRSSLSATIGGTKDFLNSYSYDTLSRLVTMQQVDQNGGNVVASKEVAYAYNAIGDVTARSAYNFVGVGPRYDIATSAISYNTLGQLTGIAMTSDVGQVPLDNLTYSYDTLGRVSTFGSIDGTAAYGYDKTSQLTSASYVAASGHAEPPNFTVTFDPNGTRTSADGVSTTVGADNHLASDGTFTFAYDPAGNLTTRTRISSATANDYKTVYLWDYRNRLTDVEFYNNSGTLTQHVHYVYDVWNNLIERDLDPSGSGTYTQIVHYVWDSPESQGAGGVVLAFNGADQLIARYLNGPNTSAYDQYYSTLVEEDVTSTSQGGTLTFPLLDQQGSVVDIADDSGNLADHIVYFSTGGVFSESHPSVPHIAGFQGGYIDVVTGMEKFGARWEYMAGAFWASQDPIGLLGDVNLGRVDSNNQSNETDANGLMPNRRDAMTLDQLLDYVKQLERNHPDDTPREILVRLRDAIKGARGVSSAGYGTSRSACPSGSRSTSPAKRLSFFTWGYIYTKDAGWIDLGHFTEAARFGSVLPDAAVTGVGYGVEVGQQFFGKLLPRNDRYIGVGSSAFNPEDLPSNERGAEFGDGLKDDALLSKQLKEYFDGLHALPPEQAPDYSALPSTEEEHEEHWKRQCDIDDKARQGLAEAALKFHYEHRPSGP